MAEIPWWGWVVIVAIIVGGMIAMTNAIAQRPRSHDTSAVDREEIERLKRRVEDLEYRLNRRD